MFQNVPKISVPTLYEGFQATVQLPHKTPLHSPVTGKLKLRADLAKRSAALKVIELLHQKGELLEDLKVKKREVFEYDLDESDDEDDDVKTGSRKYYRQIPPRLLESRRREKLYLHIIDMELVEPAQNPRYNLHYPERDSHCLGLLLSSPLPLIGPISIYSASGLVHVHVRGKVGQGIFWN